MVHDEVLGGWAREHPLAVDAIVAALVLAAFEMPAFDPYRHAGGPYWPLWGLAVAAPLVWRRRLPVQVLTVSLVATLGALVTRTGPDWGGLSLLIMLLGPSVALATVAAHFPTDTSQPLALLSAAAILMTSVFREATPDVIAAQLAVIAAAWLAGEAIRARRNEIALLHEGVAQRAEQAAYDERNRIARELHDVVAHQLSVIAVQAGAVRMVSGNQSPNAEALVTIEAASRQALVDLRRALGVLRGGELAGGVAPQPRLEQLDVLADRLRRAGMALKLTTSGDVSALPDGIAVCAYRIVQEALTNVLNHAGPVATVVRVACTPAEIRLEVHNDPPIAGPAGPAATAAATAATATGGGGQGLIGMRERVAAYGGSLHAGPLSSGAFSVTARMPLA